MSALAVSLAVVCRSWNDVTLVFDSGGLGAADARSPREAPGSRPNSLPNVVAGGVEGESGAGVGMEITNTSPFIVKMLVEGGAALRSGEIQGAC